MFHNFHIFANKCCEIVPDFIILHYYYSFSEKFNHTQRDGTPSERGFLLKLCQK